MRTLRGWFSFVGRKEGRRTVVFLLLVMAIDQFFFHLNWSGYFCLMKIYFVWNLPWAPLPFRRFYVPWRVFHVFPARTMCFSLSNFFYEMKKKNIENELVHSTCVGLTNNGVEIVIFFLFANTYCICESIDSRSSIH